VNRLRIAPDLGTTTYWGRYLHTIGRVLSAAELLHAAAKQHRADSTARADELEQLAWRLAEIGEGLRVELEKHQHE
jgi:hypothetical protein